MECIIDKIARGCIWFAKLHPFQQTVLVLMSLGVLALVLILFYEWLKRKSINND